jgi:superfamily II DNA or RNA helicase
MRPYQQEAIAGVQEAWGNGSRATLIVLPTGTGKTICFAEIVRQRLQEGRAMILAHRGELVHQAKRKIDAVCGVRSDIEMAEYEAQHGIFGKSPVVIGTVQTQVAGRPRKRMERFDPHEFATLIIDECHHATADTYTQIVDYYSQNPDLRILGVTATPDRADEEALGQVFDTVSYDYELPDAVRDGWLVHPQRQGVEVVDYDLADVRTTAGDLNGGDLSEILESDPIVDAMTKRTAEIIDDRRTLVFAESCDQAQLWCAKFNTLYGKSAIYIDGKTDKDERKQLLAEYAEGKHQILCNVGIATEGFDDPGIRIVVMARPTKSRSLYSQMLGRGTRPLEEIAHRLNDLETAQERRDLIAASDKPDVLVIDFVGNTGRHKVISAADILGGKCSDSVLQRAKTILDEDEDAHDVQEALERAEQEVVEERRKAEQEQLRKRAKQTQTKAKYVETKIQSIFDTLGCEPARERAWNKGRKPTPAQKACLEKCGQWVEGMSFTQAHRLIDRIVQRRKEGKCSPKQAKLLLRFGYSPDMSFEQARRTIDAIAANGWKRPT